MRKAVVFDSCQRMRSAQAASGSWREEASNAAWSKTEPTLGIHHRRGNCRRTHIEQVPGFMAWAGSRARLIWIDGGHNKGNPCGNRAYHGFVGRDGAVISAIIGFVGKGEVRAAILPRKSPHPVA